MTALPIEDLVPEITAALRARPNLVLEAPPGAGKTTRVPPALLLLCSGEVLVLEPRRLAARMAARRVAEELGEPVGARVGYQVRFDEQVSARTRICFVTEGVLLRRLIEDPQLSRVSAVILDEFHERHLDSDLALALLLRLQRNTRPELLLIVMSATLDAAPVAAYLGECPVLRSAGRRFPLDVQYQGYSAAPLEAQVANALERVLAAAPHDDVLIFLPGSAEIRRAIRECDRIGRLHNRLLLPLFGDLSPEEQDRAVRLGAQRKVIFSTNVAESSVTIEGVSVVIDSGLARVASDSPFTGLPLLDVQRVSRASADQRAGRAARLGPGVVVRLYSQEDYQRRPAQQQPEILRRELSPVLLTLRVLGAEPVEWLDAPREEAWRAASDLLDRLTESHPARTLARLPVHPRLARLLLEAQERGAGDAACRLAAQLSAGERTIHADALRAVSAELSPNAAKVRRQLRSLLRPGPSVSHTDEGLQRSILCAFPDRVGRIRKGGEVQLSSGHTALLTGHWPGEFLAALEVGERNDRPMPVIRLAAEIQPEWLLDLFPHRVHERRELNWNREAERVEQRDLLLYDALVLSESDGAVPDATEAARMLAARVKDAGLARIADVEEVEAFLARVEFASRHSRLPKLDAEDVDAALEALCDGRRSLAEVKAAAANGGLVQALRARLPAGAEAELQRVAPERLPLKGRMVRVNYVNGQAPWMGSRLQDFFGMKQGPVVGNGQVPVLLHLLAPNQRAVQVTSDLAGFWQRLYPELRRQLMRRYPKHAWPENPSQ